MQRYAWQNLIDKSWIIVFLALTSVTVVPGQHILAQIPPVEEDDSLGTNVDDASRRITEGTRRGDALFHSFSAFSIPEGQTYTFVDPGVTTIFSRVTGDQRSNIYGGLRVADILNSPSGANLFLLNPNGIFFGQGASLDIRGSFVATTASSIVLPDGREFSRTSLAENLPLTVNTSAPVGLRFGDANPAMIANSGYLYTGQNLSLVGGSVVSDGRLGQGSEATPEREANFQDEVTLVATGAFDGISIIQMQQNGTLLRNQDGFLELPSNSLSSRVITISPPETNLSPMLSNVRAGDIVIRNSAIPDGIEIRTATLNLAASNDLIIEDSRLNTEIFERDGNSTVFNAGNNINLARTYLIGGRGDSITFQSDNNISLNDSQINSSTSGDGNALDVFLSAAGEVYLVESEIKTIAEDNSSGNGGNIEIQANSLVVENNNRDELSLFSYGKGIGDGGNINIETVDSISFNGVGAFIRSQAILLGETGDISVRSISGSISFSNSAGIFTSTADRRSGIPTSSGNTGNIEIIANSGDIILESNAQIGTSAFGTGNAGNITIRSGNGQISLNNSFVTANTFGQGSGGIINVNVPPDLPRGATLTSPGVHSTGQNVTLSGRSTIDAGTFASGPGGSVQVGAGGILLIEGDSEISVSSRNREDDQGNVITLATGDAGTLETNSGYVQLNNGRLTAESDNRSGGDITMVVDNVLLMRNSSRVSTRSAQQDGNISIQAGGIVAIPRENSDIIARSSQEGNVEIETQAIIGIAINQGMDEIPTISEVLSTGDTVLNLGIDPSQGTQELDQEPRDVELAQGCDASSGEDEAGYVDIGQGGQAAGPDDSLSSGTLATDWVDLDSAGTTSNSPTPSAAQQAAQSAQPAPTCP